jgi:hypothetical protein
MISDFVRPPDACAMTPDEILSVAGELDCGPAQSAITFAQMIAERCAQIVEEAGGDPAVAIRRAFRP